MVATLFATVLYFQDVSATKVMSKQKRLQLAEEAKDMFYHGKDVQLVSTNIHVRKKVFFTISYFSHILAWLLFVGYDAYMDNAFPADELMPLSCQGRYRGVQPDRGDLDDALGNFSLTLIDSLDMLVVVGDLPGMINGAIFLLSPQRILSEDNFEEPSQQLSKP